MNVPELFIRPCLRRGALETKQRLHRELLKVAHCTSPLFTSRGISHLAEKPTGKSGARGFNGSKHIYHQPSLRGYATSAETPKVLVNDLRHQEILVAFSNDQTVRYPSFWLRDHCQCAECAHPHTKQRQVDTFAIDPDIKATEISPSPAGLRISWSDGQHQSVYTWSWLHHHVPFNAAPITTHARSRWQHISPSSPKLPTSDYKSVMETESGLGEFLFQIRKYGYSFVADTPPTPEATESLLERIAFIRVTHYGGFWDFTSEIKPRDTAYTNLQLPAHTDNTYFTDPCGLQLFHCLLPATEGGGQSTLVDGFAAASALYKLNPDYYNVLSSVRVVSHASGDDKAGNILNNASHPGGFPLFTHAVPHTRPHPRNLTQIRWNNDDRHSSTQWPSHERMIMWYRAAKAWADILKSKEFEVEVQLQPGKPVIFDNWRTLHGRRAFQGQRRVCGGYIGMDDFLARGRVPGLQWNEGQEQIEQKSQAQQNEEFVKREQVAEEIAASKGEDIEPDVLPQKKDGVNMPIAS